MHDRPDTRALPSTGNRCRSRTAVGAVCLWVAILAAPAASFANATVYSGVSGSLEPVKTKKVALVTEDLRFRQITDTDWRVNVLYTFENRSGKTLSATVGFPRRLEHTPVQLSPVQSNPHDFIVTIDGEPQPYEVHVQGCVSETGFEVDACDEVVYLFDVEFEAGKPLHMECRYIQAISNVNSLDMWFVDYVLGTGANWKGPIESLKITYELDHSPSGLLRKPLVIFDRVFSDLQDYNMTDALIDMVFEPDAGYPVNACSGTIRMWPEQVPFAYTYSSSASSARLVLEAMKVEPRGDISMAYEPLSLGYADFRSHVCLEESYLDDDALQVEKYLGLVTHLQELGLDEKLTCDYLYRHLLGVGELGGEATAALEDYLGVCSEILDSLFLLPTCLEGPPGPVVQLPADPDWE